MARSRSATFRWTWPMRVSAGRVGVVMAGSCDGDRAKMGRAGRAEQGLARTVTVQAGASPGKTPPACRRDQGGSAAGPGAGPNIVGHQRGQTGAVGPAGTLTAH